MSDNWEFDYVDRMGQTIDQPTRTSQYLEGKGGILHRYVDVTGSVFVEPFMKS